MEALPTRVWLMFVISFSKHSISIFKLNVCLLHFISVNVMIKLRSCPVVMDTNHILSNRFMKNCVVVCKFMIHII